MSKHRPETGSMQFGDDWPGVFIRGDNAAGYALALQDILSHPSLITESPRVSVFSLMTVSGLLRLLQGCDTRSNPTCQKAQLTEATNA